MSRHRRKRLYKQRRRQRGLPKLKVLPHEEAMARLDAFIMRANARHYLLNVDRGLPASGRFSLYRESGTALKLDGERDDE